MRGASDVPMSSPCFTMNVNSPSCPCKKTTPFRGLCDEFRWDFPREVGCHPMHRCASIDTSLLRPRVRRYVFIPSFRNRFSHHCGEKAFPPKAWDMSDAGAQHSFLSVAFVNQGAVRVVCSAWRFLCCFPTDRYDGRVLQARSNLAMPCVCSFRQLFCCADKDRFCSFHHVPVKRLKERRARLKFCPLLRRRPPVRPFSRSLLAVSRGISSLLYRVGNQEGERRDACAPQGHSHQAAASVCVPRGIFPCLSRFQRGSSGRCKLSIPSTQLPFQRYEPVPCVQVLFRVIAHVPVCLCR